MKVSIKHGAKPTIKNNYIIDGQSAGVYVRGNAGGTIESNHILRSAKVAICLSAVELSRKMTAVCVFAGGNRDQASRIS